MRARRFAPSHLALTYGSLSSAPLGRAARGSQRPRPSSASSPAPTASCRAGSRSPTTSRRSTRRARASRVRTLGKTTLGRPFIVAFISDSATLANLERYRQIQRKLMDPRLRAAGERERLHRRRQERHPRHVGDSLDRSRRLHDAARARRPAGARAGPPRRRQILANTIIMLVPSQNPDGVDIVGDYYRATLGTPAEGSEPPDLYHQYTGHDNNRDWYAFTQPETRYTVDSLYTPWDPQIVNDIHQQGGDGGPHLHSAVHGSGRAEHRSDPHRRRRTRSAWRWRGG